VGISLLQEHILNFLLDFLPKHNCMLRIVHCLGVEQANKEKNADDALTMPVFVVVATKFKSLPMPVSRLPLYIAIIFSRKFNNLLCLFSFRSWSLVSATIRCRDSPQFLSLATQSPQYKRPLWFATVWPDPT